MSALTASPESAIVSEAEAQKVATLVAVPSVGKDLGSSEERRRQFEAAGVRPARGILWKVDCGGWPGLSACKAVALLVLQFIKYSTGTRFIRPLDVRADAPLRRRRLG